MSDILDQTFGMGGSPGGPPQPQGPPQGASPQGPPGSEMALNPGIVEGLVKGVNKLREIMPNDDQIVDFIMQAIAVRGLEIQEDQVAQIVQAVPRTQPGATGAPTSPGPEGFQGEPGGQPPY